MVEITTLKIEFHINLVEQEPSYYKIHDLRKIMFTLDLVETDAPFCMHNPQEITLPSILTKTPEVLEHETHNNHSIQSPLPTNQPTTNSLSRRSREESKNLPNFKHVLH